MAPTFPRSSASCAAGVLTTLVGIAVLAGWHFDIAILKYPLHGAVSMKANSAAAFLLAGLALMALQSSHVMARRLVQFLALAVTIVGILSLVQDFFDWDIGFAQILYREPEGAIGTSHPGLMATNTAMAFVLLGIASFLLAFRTTRTGFLIEFPLVFSLFISILGILGYLTGLKELTGFVAHTQMSIHTGATFIILCVGMLLTAYGRQRAPITIQQKLFAGLTAAAAVIIFISFLSISGIESLLQASGWVEQRNHAKSQIDEVLAKVLEVQSGERGFLLSGDERYLAAHNAAARELSALMDTLRIQTGDNPRQRDFLATLKVLLEERVAFSDRVVSSRRTEGGKEISNSMFATGQGKLITDRIRDNIAQMLAEEDRLLQSRSGDELGQATRNQSITYLSLAMQVLLLVFIFVLVDRDVAGRRQSEAQLRRLKDELEDRVKERTAALLASETKYRELFENAQVGMYRSKLDGSALVSVNSKLCEIFGYSKEEMIGNPATIRWADPLARDRMVAEIQKTGALHDYEVDIVTKRGEIRTCLVSIQLNAEKGYIEGSAIDITEHKRSEELIQGNEKRLRELIESLPQLFWTTRVDGPCDYLSKQWVEYTGIPEEEQFGYRWLEQLHPDDKDRTVTGWMDRVKTGEAFDIDFRIRRHDGVYHWFKTRAVPMRNAAGHIAKWFGSNTDVDEIMRAEEQSRTFSNELERKVAERTLELQRNKEKLDETARIGRIGGWQLDLTTNELEWSDILKQIHGVAPNFQPTLETAIAFYAPASLPAMSEAVRLAIEEGQSYDIEAQLKTAGQQIIWVRAIGQAYRDNGRIVRIGGVFQDINERKLAEQERETLLHQLEHRTALLEAANAELEAFTYSVSHDLRAPLRHVSGYVDLLAKDFQAGLPEKGVHYLESIADSARQMGKLIDNLLQFSRTGRAEMHLSQLEMNAIVQEIIASVGKDNPERAIEWVVGPLPSVCGDEATLRLVWVNLLSNAVKFTQTRDKVLIEIGAKTETNGITFFVRDNGVGFDMKYAQKLFGVFQRLHSTEEFEGTGIGLAHVHRIVVRHGGRTWAEAEVDKGATFYFSIPSN